MSIFPCKLCVLAKPDWGWSPYLVEDTKTLRHWDLSGTFNGLMAWKKNSWAPVFEWVCIKQAHTATSSPQDVKPLELYSNCWILNIVSYSWMCTKTNHKVSYVYVLIPHSRILIQLWVGAWDYCDLVCLQSEFGEKEKKNSIWCTP